MRKSIAGSVVSLLILSLFASLISITPIQQAQATTLFSNGFEEGKFNPAAGVWTGNSTDNGGVASVQSTIKYSGTYAANLTTDGSLAKAYAYKKLPSNYTNVFFSGMIRASTLPTNQALRHGLLWMGPSSSSPSPNTGYGVQVIWNYTSGVGVYWGLVVVDAGANWHSNVSMVTPSVDTWYNFTLSGFSNAATGNATLMVDGAEVASLVGFNTVWGNYNFDEIAIYCCSYGVVEKAYYDDIVVTDVYTTSTSPSILQISQNTTLAGEVASFNARWQANTGNLSHHILSFDNGTDTYTNDTAVAFSAGVSVAWANVTSHRINVTSGTTCHWKSYANNTAGLWSVSSTQTFETTTSATSLTIQSTPISVLYGINSSAYSFPSWTVSTPVTASGIKIACDQAIAAGGGTVYIPAGDWDITDKAVDGYGVGGAVFIDLEALPENAWLNIIGAYTNTTVITQNGQTIKEAPSTILRSDTPFYNTLTSPTAIFSVVGSNVSASANFNFVKSANRHIRISGLTILGYVLVDGGVVTYGNDGIQLHYVDGYLIDHVVMDSFTANAVMTVSSKGVISHSVFLDLYHEVIGGIGGYGVGVYGNFAFYGNNLGNPTWIENVSQLIGKYDWQGTALNWTVPVKGDFSVKGTTSTISFTAGPVYIEYSQFNATRHPVASSQYGYYVFRYNEVFGGVGLPAIDQHGGGWSVAANAYAGRGCEIYNVTLDGNVPELSGIATYSVGMRGGAGLIFNNTFTDTHTGIALGNENYNTSWPTYPEYINDMWIWNNTFSGVTTELSVNTGVGITAGTNYFSDIPTPTTPAPPKPSYTTYTTPHPLTLGSYFGTTNTTLTLQPAIYVVQVPDSVIVSGVSYTFDEWDDTSTNPVRTITLSSNTIITANYTISSAIPHWQFTFTHKDLDLNTIDSKITWILYNASTSLTYTEGAYTLLDGTYTLCTYYRSKLINSTSLATSTLGNNTITLALPIKLHASVANGYIAFNETITSITINEQTNTRLSFTTIGNGGTYFMAVGVLENATSITKDGSPVTGWVYDATNHVITVNSTLSTWVFTFPATNTAPGSSGTSSSELVFRVLLHEEPVDGCEIQLFEKPYNLYKMTVYTDADGCASAFVGFGEYTYIARHGDYEFEGEIFHIEYEAITIHLDQADASVARPAIKTALVFTILAICLVCGAVFAFSKVRSMT